MTQLNAGDIREMILPKTNHFHRRQSSPEVTIPFMDGAFGWLKAHADMARFYISRIPPSGYIVATRDPNPISMHTDNYEFAEKFENATHEFQAYVVKKEENAEPTGSRAKLKAAMETEGFEYGAS